MHYSDEQVKAAIEEGIFSETSVNQFKELIKRQQNNHPADEENFRLLASFNDVFVVIALILLFLSINWIFNIIAIWLGMLISALLAWKLSEVFILEKRMAFPAITLVIAFILSSAMIALPFTKSLLELLNFKISNDTPYFIATAGVGALAARLHWKRFRVPITIAAICAVVIGFLFAIFIVNKELIRLIPSFSFVAGMVVFAYAFIWDASDTKRNSQNTDVAFWLHLLAAPLLVHPIFIGLGIFEGDIEPHQSLLVLGIYLFISCVSLIIDRRALMVSSLGYVLFSFSNILKSFGAVEVSFAITGLVISIGLLTISAFWHQCRQFVLKFTPIAVLQFVPN